MARKPNAKKAAKTKASERKVPAKLAAKSGGLDFSAFPPESIVRDERVLCLACILDVFTRHLGIVAARAQAEIKRHQLTLEELSSPEPARPYFAGAGVCPYCAAPAKWHAPFSIVRIEGGKTTDAPRRALLKKLGTSPNFAVLEEKSTERDELYEWLARTGATLDLDHSEWLLEAARHWLGRKLPKEDWGAIFGGVRMVRRSRRLEGAFAAEGPRLFLAPELFDEILLIQYLLSRSHKAGGLTFEGRLTLNDLFHRLRGGGYLRTVGITSGNASDTLERLIDLLGGEGRVKVHYVVDRRKFLAKLADLRTARIPRPHAS